MRSPESHPLAVCIVNKETLREDSSMNLNDEQSIEQSVEKIVIDYGDMKESPRFEQSIEFKIQPSVKGGSRERINKHPKVCMGLQSDGLVDLSKSKLFTYEPKNTPAIFKDIKFSQMEESRDQITLQNGSTYKSSRKPLVTHSFLAPNRPQSSVDDQKSKWASRVQSLHSSYHLDTSKVADPVADPNIGLTFSKNGYASKVSQITKNVLPSSSINYAMKHIKGKSDSPGGYPGHHSQDRLTYSEAWKRSVRQDTSKGYLDKMITENDRLLEKIAKRLVDKGKAKRVNPDDKVKNRSQYRPSQVRPSGAQAWKAVADRNRQPFKPTIKQSSYLELNVQYSGSVLDQRHRWRESKSVENTYSKYLPSHSTDSHSYFDPKVQGSISSLHHRRALSKFIKQLK